VTGADRSVRASEKNRIAESTKAKTKKMVRPSTKSFAESGGRTEMTMPLQLHALRSPAFAEVYNEMNRKHRRALGTMMAQLFELFGKQVPGERSEIATGLAMLSRGLSLAPAAGDSHRAGRILLTFLKALIEAAPAADKAKKPRGGKASG